MDKTFIGVVVLSVAASTALYIYRTRDLAHGSSAESKLVVDAKSEGCKPSGVRFRWPLNGKSGLDYVIVNYVDDDVESNGVRDYTGAKGDLAMTYNTHTGVDMEISGFKIMDEGVPVLAAADGVVEEFFDQSADRNLICSQERWNFIKLRHSNGYSSFYGHLKRATVDLTVGATVKAGERLALVGSSGCSAYPHLHFEVQDCQGTVVDPFKLNMFVSPPDYARGNPAYVMETILFQPPVNTIVPIQDPGLSDVQSVSVGQPFTFGMTVSNMRSNDLLRVEFTGPDGIKSPNALEFFMDRFRTRSHWWGTVQLAQTGRWSAAIKLNGRILLDRPIQVLP